MSVLKTDLKKLKIMLSSDPSRRVESVLIEMFWMPTFETPAKSLFGTQKVSALMEWCAHMGG